MFQNQGSVSLIEESGRLQSSYKLDVWVFVDFRDVEMHPKDILYIVYLEVKKV